MALYRFGGFEFDSTTGELRTTGHVVRLRPQPARALSYLLEHHGELVNRRDLQRAIWPDDTFVHFDHGLNSCIKQIRAALGDSRATPAYIETLVRRGFRFIAPVIVVSPNFGAATPELAVVATTAMGSGTLCHVWVGRFDATAEQLVREVIASMRTQEFLPVDAPARVGYLERPAAE